MRMTYVHILAVVSTMNVAICGLAFGADPWADQVIAYQDGSNAQVGYYDPQMAVGEPSKFTPDETWGDSDVTMFSSAWKPDQVVSIGAGGHLIVKFDEPVEDDPLNPYGIDLLVFGNAGFADSAWPDGVVAGVFDEPGVIEVSQDGVSWRTISGVFADDMWPTQAYTNTSGPYAADGTNLSDFTKPMDPALSLAGVTGLTYAQVLAIYDGSAGGTGVDISGTGLGWIQYVKVWQDANDDWSTEIDGFADVTAIPEPISMAILLLGLPAALGRRGK